MRVTGLMIMRSLGVIIVYFAFSRFEYESSLVLKNTFTLPSLVLDCNPT